MFIIITFEASKDFFQLWSVSLSLLLKYITNVNRVRLLAETFRIEM